MSDASRSRIIRQLRAWKLDGLAASLLENGGPLAFLGAQALHAAGPLLQPWDEGELASLAHLLEDPAQVQALAAELAGPEPATEVATTRRGAGRGQGEAG